MVKKVHFMTGKGGVGKSTLAAAFAYKISQSNTKTLLTEFNDQSFFQDFLERPAPVGYSPTSLKPNLDLALWSPESCLKEYALHLLKVESLYKLFFENPVSKSLIQVAPGLHELALLGKATSSPRKHGPAMNYDEVVIDSYSTGHFISLLRAPAAMAQAIQFGPMGEQSRSIDHWLRQPDFTKINIVTLPEALPITEAVELFHQLHSEFGLTAEIILNKTWGLSDSDISQLSPALKERFTEKLNHEAEALELLEKDKIPFQKIPLMTEIQSLKIIEQIAQVIHV